RHVGGRLVTPENLVPGTGRVGDLLLVYAVEEAFEHTGPVVFRAQPGPTPRVDVHAAPLPVPERAGGAQRRRPAFEARAIAQVSVARDVAREARNEVRLDVGDPDVGAPIEQLAEHLGAGPRVADDEERRLGARHRHSGSKTAAALPTGGSF